MAKTRLMLRLLPLLLASPAPAGPVPELYLAVSRFCDVPARLLYAVAKAESGRDLAGEGVEPWPWTLNIEGESHYYDSREAVFEALMPTLAEGRVVDIGLMQLNWGWKFDDLMSPWLATDPYFNTNTACRIIRTHYEADKTAGWFAAVGRYHREADAPKHEAARRAYTDRVRRLWER